MWLKGVEPSNSSKTDGNTRLSFSLILSDRKNGFDLEMIECIDYQTRSCPLIFGVRDSQGKDDFRNDRAG